jgi:hypothetical protein
VIKWIKLRRKYSYKDLYEMYFGGSHEGDKGLKREYDFMLSILLGWKSAYLMALEYNKKLEAEIKELKGEV